MIDTTKNETPVKVLNLPIAGPYTAAYNSDMSEYVALGPGFISVCNDRTDAEVLAARMNNAYIMGFVTSLLATVNS